ncbi:MAG: M6 family metalloprotease domain-containing protein [Bacteroidales bacterium]|nr:M6 family metalloprotease domain-containing protein [Bacteroidales bacterium]
MKKIFAIAIAALCCCVSTLAVPAYPGWRSYTQPDGSVIRIRLHGDEFCHWTTDASGQTVALDADGFYRPVSEAQLNARRIKARAARAEANARRRYAPAKAGVASGQKHFLVILVEFSDVHFSSSTANADFTAMLNNHNYSVNGGTGSARDYYYDNSGGAFEPIFDVYGPVRLDNNQAYYGGNDSNDNDLRPEDAVKEGCQSLNTSIDFSSYDNDNDGEVDLVFMYYAGRGEADGGSEDCIWPHQWEFTSAGISLTLDGKKINKYACSNEIVEYSDGLKMCGIGTACHEFGHAMGLPDFYDTDYKTNGVAGGLYEYSTMCSGSYNNEGRTPPYFNIEERILLGWQQPSIIQEFGQSGTYTLTSVSGNVAYKTLTDMDGEYFVYECRSKTGWDAYIPEAGLIVYHVDKSSREVSISRTSSPVTASSLWNNWSQYNSINENGSHPCFYVVPAGSQTSLNYTGSEWAFTGTAGKKTYTAKSWNGVDSDVQLSSITYSGGQVSLYATVPSSSLNYNVIANPGNGDYTAGSYFALTLLESEAQPVSSVAWFYDDEPVSGSSVRLTAGKHVVEAHLTLVSGESKILELTLNVQ